MSDEQTTLLYRGASASQLGMLFDMSPQEVNKRLSGHVVPVMNGKTALFRIRDAAPRLCNPVLDLEALFKSLPPQKWPPALQDTFWKGQNSRQKFEEEQGDLYRTRRVVEVFADVFKVVRMTAMTFMDEVDRVEELTPKQRKVVTSLTDGLIDLARHRLIEEFKDYIPAEDEHGENVYADGEAEVSEHVVAHDDGFGDL